MQYTFGVITYNQEKFITETLESIKYQIETFGKDENNCPIEIYLYISDDFSQDRTVFIINEWTNKNSYLFKEIKILKSTENHGTVYSYIRLLNLINTEYFKILAGDDLFSCDDVFEGVKNNSSYYDAVAYNPLILYSKDDSSEWLLKPDLYLLNTNLFYGNKRRNNKYDLEHQILGGYFNTPSFFPKRQLLNQECINYLNGIRLFEDDPTWHMLLKTNKSLSIRFDDKVKVLYRIHSKSISNGKTNGKGFQLFIDDWIFIVKRFISEEKNIFNKLYLFFHLIDIQNSKKGINKKITFYKVFYKLRVMYIYNRTRKYHTQLYSNNLENIIKDNCDYYKRIRASSEAFLSILKL